MTPTRDEGKPLVTARPPTVRLRRLASELKRARKAAGLSQDDVTSQTGISPATLYRIEKPESRPQRRTLTALIDLYGVDTALRERILALHEGADTSGWFRPPYHHTLRDEYNALMQFEAEAHTLCNFETLFIPGLLQTEDYARAVLQGLLPGATANEIEQRVQTRLERQKALSKPPQLRLTAILDESALHRRVGGDRVMADQLRHLHEAADRPGISVHVIPYSAGAHPGMPGSFALLSFPDVADGDIVYIESMASDTFLEAETDIRRYREIFDALAEKALPAPETLTMINLAIREMTELETA